MPFNIKCKQNCVGDATELHRFIYIFLNPVLMQFNMDTFLNHMSNSHLHYLRATITFSKVVVTKKVRFKSKV